MLSAATAVLQLDRSNISGSQCCHLLPSVGDAWYCSSPVNFEHFFQLRLNKQAYLQKLHNLCALKLSKPLACTLNQIIQRECCIVQVVQPAFVRAPCINYRVSIRRVSSSKIAPTVWLLSITGRFYCSWFPTLNTELHRISVGVRLCARVRA